MTQVEEEGALDVMEPSEEAFKVQDDIPLIDDTLSVDDVSTIVDRMRQTCQRCLTIIFGTENTILRKFHLEVVYASG